MAKRNSWLLSGILTGAIGAITTAAAIAAYGKRKEGSAWTPFNAIAHMALGEQTIQKEGYSSPETLTGLGLHSSAVLTWGAMYEKLAGKTPFPKSLATGAAASGIIYLLDYHILPPKMRPGFEKRLGNQSVATVYGLLALVLGLSPLWKQSKGKG